VRSRLRRQEALYDGEKHIRFLLLGAPRVGRARRPGRKTGGRRSVLAKPLLNGLA
jgi:hypothetical protein